MRTHQTILFVACYVVGGCSSETVGPPPAAPVNWQSLEVKPVVDAGADMVTAKERALPDAYARAIESQGVAQLGPILDEDAHFVSPGMDDAHGRSAVVLAHGVLFGAFDDRKVALSRVWRTPGVQTVEWTMSGTQGRDFFGVSPTLRPVRFKGLTLLWTKDDGSVTDVHVYLDVAVVKAQLGIGPKELLALPIPPSPATAGQIYEQTQTLSSDEKTNVEVVKSALDALENNHEHAYVGAMTDDLEVTTLERAEPLRNKDGAKAYYRTMHKAIGQLDTTVDNAWGVRQFAIIEYSIAGEQLGAIGWIPVQRDKVIRFGLVDVCEVIGGKVAHVWRYDNPAQIGAGGYAQL